MTPIFSHTPEGSSIVGSGCGSGAPAQRPTGPSPSVEPLRVSPASAASVPSRDPADLAELERAYREAEGALASEQQRFSQTLSARYSPARLMALGAERARARDAYFNAEFGERDRSVG